MLCATVAALLFAILSLAGCGKQQEALMLEVLSQGTEAETTQSSLPDVTEASVLVVHICGAVVSPGVYEVESDARLDEGIRLAGGFTDQADQTVWNLAQKLVDGEMYYIPTITETACGDFTEKSSDFSGEETDERLISINSASKAELMTLPGIGEAKATAIIAYREEHGSFTSIEQIMEVDGIKQSVYEKIKSYITVS